LSTRMPELKLQISVSLDGYLAGPNQSEEHPLGEGGEALHDWALKLAAWREPHGREGGEVNASTEVFEEASENVGAILIGRNMFGGGPGPWGEDPWQGWWGDEPPFKAPVFVLTHHEREPLVKGETTFHFVTDGSEAALERAREVAGDRDVAIGGGARTVQQYLAAGEIDEILIALVPVLLGDGTPLFDNLGDSPPRFDLIEVVDAPGVTHLRYAVARA
jgi:dihydrofolate reductase